MYTGKMGIVIILVLLNFVVIASCVTEPESGLIIAVGTGSASPGTENTSVNVALDNVVPVKGVQMDICDAGDYLTCTGCEPTARASGFDCLTNELRHGCVRILLYSMGDVIDVGTGPLFSLNYDVVDEAPSAECINLTPAETKVSDENKSFIDATVEPGEFCIN